LNELATNTVVNKTEVNKTEVNNTMSQSQCNESDEHIEMMPESEKKYLTELIGDVLKDFLDEDKFISNLVEQSAQDFNLTSTDIAGLTNSTHCNITTNVSILNNTESENVNTPIKNKSVDIKDFNRTENTIFSSTNATEHPSSANVTENNNTTLNSITNLTNETNYTTNQSELVQSAKKEIASEVAKSLIVSELIKTKLIQVYLKRKMQEFEANRKKSQIVPPMFKEIEIKK
jgi:hypothetical protein